MSAPFDPWPDLRINVRAKMMPDFAQFSKEMGVPSLVPTSDQEGRDGPPVLFVWHPEGEDEDHGVIMNVAADGRFEVTLTHGMANADLFHRLVGYCVAEGVPFEVSPDEPAPVGEGGA